MVSENLDAARAAILSAKAWRSTAHGAAAGVSSASMLSRMRVVSALKQSRGAHAWNSFDADHSIERRVCDYIAGMTDPYAERIYHRLFTPGMGSSRDEL